MLGGALQRIVSPPVYHKSRIFIKTAPLKQSYTKFYMGINKGVHVSHFKESEGGGNISNSSGIHV